MKHTKGPWIKVTGDNGNRLDSNGSVIKHQICCDINDADFDLIAAAPEMLEVLERIVLTYREGELASKWAAEVIKKARGES